MRNHKLKKSEDCVTFNNSDLKLKNHNLKKDDYVTFNNAEAARISMADANGSPTRNAYVCLALTDVCPLSALTLATLFPSSPL